MTVATYGSVVMSYQVRRAFSNERLVGIELFGNGAATVNGSTRERKERTTDKVRMFGGIAEKTSVEVSTMVTVRITMRWMRGKRSTLGYSQFLCHLTDASFPISTCSKHRSPIAEGKTESPKQMTSKA